MTVKAKKMRLLALLASLCLLLAGCGELPPAALQQSTPEGQTPLSARGKCPLLRKFNANPQHFNGPRRTPDFAGTNAPPRSSRQGVLSVGTHTHWMCVWLLMWSMQ